jgi:hypothetical protein
VPENGKVTTAQHMADHHKLISVAKEKVLFNRTDTKDYKECVSRVAEINRKFRDLRTTAYSEKVSIPIMNEREKANLEQYGSVCMERFKQVLNDILEYYSSHDQLLNYEAFNTTSTYGILRILFIAQYGLVDKAYPKGPNLANADYKTFASYLENMNTKVVDSIKFANEEVFIKQ